MLYCLITYLGDLRPHSKIPGSSRYVKFLPFVIFFGEKANFTHLEDPGIWSISNFREVACLSAQWKDVFDLAHAASAPTARLDNFVEASFSELLKHLAV